VVRTVFADGTWQPWSGSFPPPDIRPIGDIACSAGRTGDVFVFALAREGTLYYTNLLSNDMWHADFPPPDIRPVLPASWYNRPISCALLLLATCISVLSLRREGFTTPFASRTAAGRVSGGMYGPQHHSRSTGHVGRLLARPTKAVISVSVC
jgi:hypothetical protein